MGKWESVGYVAVPQALRRSVPSFQNEATIVLKDTSVVFAIGLSELLTRSYDLFTRETTATLEVILTISAIYFALTFVTNRGLDYVESVYRIPGGESA
jgi:polar amino acid transport system permease protein